MHRARMTERHERDVVEIERVRRGAVRERCPAGAGALRDAGDPRRAGRRLLRDEGANENRGRFRDPGQHHPERVGKSLRGRRPRLPRRLRRGDERREQAVGRTDLDPAASRRCHS